MIDQLCLLQYGALAGIVAKTITAPLDRLTKLKQTGAVRQELKLVEVCASIRTTEGLAGFWKGNLANCLRAAPQKGLLFVFNDAYRTLFEKAGIPIWLTGGLAGCTSTVLTYPLDTVQVLKAGLPGVDKQSLLQKGLSLYRDRGIAKGLFPGLGITLLGSGPYYSIKFTAYEWLQGWVVEGRGNGAKLGQIEKVTCGAVASMIGNLIMYPNNIVRRTMQAQGGPNVQHYSGILQCYIGTYRTGLKSFYRGMLVNLVRAAPNTGMQFYVYESLKELHFAGKRTPAKTRP